ncbi:MAG TPA: pyruvate kinase [Nitrospiraceae bacterium]|nr:pyruvate kinase [Nitrospiraceae bacterium]
MRKAKIVCTIGPASSSPEMLEQLIGAGMNVARLNFSHGTHESHARAIQTIRQAAQRTGAAVAILQDIQGPRIRIGRLSDAGVTLEAGQRVRLLAGQAAFDPRSGIHYSGKSVAPNYTAELPVTYEALARDVRSGARILINDGLIELKAERIAGDAVECSVVTGGLVTSHKGLNLPGTAVSAPTLTDKDREDLRFGVAQQVDYAALSFVRGAADIAAARQLIAGQGGEIPLIAKIERPEAIEQLEAILDEADGVMIARGDLGVEMGPEVVPILQKRIILAANRRRKLVITATQMLESMTEHPRPTRAEASDVANAVFDGTDAVMLSAETAAGQYPVESVRVMDRIVRAAEEGAEPGVLRVAERSPAPSVPDSSFPEAMCAAACSAVATTRADAVVVFSESGATARLMSKQRPSAPIVAVTPSESIRRRMTLYWGVVSLTMPRIEQTDARVHEIERRLKEEGLAKSGQRIVILSGTIIGQRGGTNVMKLHEVA